MAKFIKFTKVKALPLLKHHDRMFCGDCNRFPEEEEIAKAEDVDEIGIWTCFIDSIHINKGRYYIVLNRNVCGGIGILLVSEYHYENAKKILLEV